MLFKWVKKKKKKKKKKEEMSWKAKFQLDNITRIHFSSFLFKATMKWVYLLIDQKQSSY